MACLLPRPLSPCFHIPFSPKDFKGGSISICNWQTDGQLDTLPVKVCLPFICNPKKRALMLTWKLQKYHTSFYFATLLLSHCRWRWGQNQQKCIFSPFLSYSCSNDSDLISTGFPLRDPTIGKLCSEVPGFCRLSKWPWREEKSRCIPSEGIRYEDDLRCHHSNYDWQNSS